MARYKFERFLKFCGDKAYDTALQPSSAAPRAGIYRCDGCGFEITALAGEPLPGADHHLHQKLVRWKLIVADSGPPAPSHMSTFAMHSNARVNGQ